MNIPALLLTSTIQSMLYFDKQNQLSRLLTKTEIPLVTVTAGNIT